MKSAREVAADILCDVDEGGKSNSSFLKHVNASNLQESDKDFAKLLVNGTLEHINEIDSIINANSKKHADKLKPIIRNVLRVSIFQLYYLKNIPVFAVCNEAVKIVNRRKLFGLKNFVNAILRNISRNVPQGSEDTLAELPDLVIDVLKTRCNENFDKVRKAFGKPSRTSCRFLLSKASSNEIILSLENDGVKVSHSNLVDNGYYIEGFDDVSKLKAFNDGFIQIQGISSIKAVEALNPIKGSVILDICAAPGGKTIALADVVELEGLVVSRDLTQSKVDLINQNINRCGLGNIVTEVKDATIFYKEDEGRFDYVLADLPCSGLGTIGHKIEIRNRISKDKIIELATLQKKILDNAVRYVKPGGYLLYSTCTLSFEENEENSEYIEKLGLRRTDINDITLIPGIDEVEDGFFYSLFKKEA